MTPPTLEEVWSLYGDRLRGYLRSRMADASEVDDVLQLVMYKTHEQLPSVRNLAHLRAWLFRVAQNAVVDHHRKVVRRREDFEEPPDTEQGSDELASRDQVELLDCVRAFVERLPAKDREVLEAVDLDGLSQRAVADQLGVSYSTVKSRVQRARERLAHDLRSCCDVEIAPSGAIVGTPRERTFACEKSGDKN